MQNDEQLPDKSANGGKDDNPKVITTSSSLYQTSSYNPTISVLIHSLHNAGNGPGGDQLSFSSSSSQHSLLASIQSTAASSDLETRKLRSHSLLPRLNVNMEMNNNSNANNNANNSLLPISPGSGSRALSQLNFNLRKFSHVPTVCSLTFLASLIQLLNDE